jgi:hypothetical protein
MRIIPKKSKVNLTIWRNFTLSDVLAVGVLAVVAFLIIRTNFSWKWYLLAGIGGLAVIALMPVQDTRPYKSLLPMLRHLVSVKAFSAKDPKPGKNVAVLVPQQKLLSSGVIDYGGYYAGVIAVGSIEFRLLNEWAQNQKISALARILNALSPDQSAQLVKIDRPVNFDEIAGSLFKKIKGAQEEKPVDEAKLAVLRSRLAQIDRINNEQKQYRPYYYFVLFDEKQDGLESMLTYVTAAMSEQELPAHRLSQKELAVFLKYCYTRDFDERAVEALKPEEYLAWVKPEALAFAATRYRVDDVSAFSLTVSDYPLTVGNAWGAALFNIDNTKVVLNIKPVDADKATRRIDRAVNELATKTGVNKASEVIAQDTHIDTMVALAQNLQNDNERLFDCTLTVTGFHYNTDKVDFSTFRRNVRREITSKSIRTDLLFCRQRDGFVSSNITRRDALRSFDRGINSESLAAVFPFVFTSTIDEDGVTLGYNNYPVILDLYKWQHNPAYVNANAFCVGKPGSGKSYFTKLLLSLLYGDNTRIFVLDPENEYTPLCKNVGGSWIDVGTATTGRLNPFHIYDILTDSGESAASEVVFYAHLRMLEGFFKVTLPGLSAAALEEINNLLPLVYEKKGIRPDIELTTLKATDFPIFDDLMAVLDAAVKAETGIVRKTELQRAVSYLEKFCAGGRYSNLWNGASTLRADSRFVVFNFQSLLSSKNATISNGQTLLVLRFLEQQIINMRELNRAGHEQVHPLVAIDEGYVFVDPNYPIALNFIFEWYKRIRKYGGTMLFLTQNLADILGNQEVIAKTSAIINNSNYSFVFSLAPADIEVLTDLYKNSGGINDTEQGEIANATKGQCFLIAGTRERNSFQVKAAEDIVALFTNVRV